MSTATIKRTYNFSPVAMKHFVLKLFSINTPQGKTIDVLNNQLSNQFLQIPPPVCADLHHFQVLVGRQPLQL